MAESKLAWTAHCDCYWVKLSGNGVNGSNPTYTGNGSVPSITVTADAATGRGDSTDCTVTFTSEDNKTATLKVTRCSYGCSCSDYTVTVNNPSYKIPASGVTNYSYFTIVGNNGCSVNSLVGISDRSELTVSNDGRITVPANTGGGKEFKIDFKYNNSNCAGKSFTILQEGRDCSCSDLVVSSTGTSCSCAGGTFSVSNLITDNCDSGVKKEISVTTTASWITNLYVDGNGTLHYTASDRSADGDYGDSARTADIIIAYGGSNCSSKTFRITQGTCGCSCDEFTISGSKTAEIDCSGVTNMKLDASVVEVGSLCSTKPTVREVRLGTPSGSATTLVTASTNSDGTVTISVAKNEGEDSRTFYVVFKMGDANTCDSTANAMLKIVQSDGCQPKGACGDITITTTAATWECSDETGTTKTIGTISVKSGAANPDDWAITLNGVPSWITTGRSGNDITATINAKCTTSCEPRTGTITFDAKNGDVSCSNKASVTVTQKCCANITIVADPPQTEMTCSGGTVTFSISTT